MRANIKKILSSISPTLLSRILYYRSFGRNLNLKNPTLFNEKLMWLKLKKYEKDRIYTVCADKYMVREYIIKCGCEEILNEILGVYNKPEDIDFEILPDKFVLKCNHGAGYNIICEDKAKLNIENTKKQLNRWLKEDYWKTASELQYKKIPKKIICEKYLESKNKTRIEDYKIYCFNGKAKLVMLCVDRDKDNTKYYYFDKSWNLLKINKWGKEANEGFDVMKPSCMSKMFEYAERLAKPFEFVRVDLYNYMDKPIFGELTFTPSACLDKNYDMEAYKELGDMINLK